MECQIQIPALGEAEPERVICLAILSRANCWVSRGKNSIVTHFSGTASVAAFQSDVLLYLVQECLMDSHVERAAKQ